MKITFEFEYPHELSNLLESIARNWKLPEPVNYTDPDVDKIYNPKIDEPMSEATASRILDEFKVHTATIEKD